MATRRLLLVDESPDLLKGLEDWFEEQPGFEVAHCARSGNEALAQVAALAPDVVLLDMGLHDVNGLELARRIKSGPRPTVVILMTFHESHAVRALAESVRADGLVVKSRLTEELSEVLATLDAVEGTLPVEPLAPTNEDPAPTRGTNPRRKL